MPSGMEQFAWWAPWRQSEFRGLQKKIKNFSLLVYTASMLIWLTIMLLCSTASHAFEDTLKSMLIFDNNNQCHTIGTGFPMAGTRYVLQREVLGKLFGEPVSSRLWFVCEGFSEDNTTRTNCDKCFFISCISWYKVKIQITVHSPNTST